MNVRELKELLEELPEDMNIIMSKDSEGNYYSPLSGYSKDAIYLPDSTWSGDVYMSEWSADDAGMDEEDWASLLSEGERVLVIWPTN